MSPRTTLTRLGITAAATALSLGAVTPALASPADDDWGSSWNQQQPPPNNQSNTNNPNQNNQNQNPNNQNQNSQSNQNNQSGNHQSGNGDWSQHNNTSSNAVLYKGIVTANGGLRLRSAPNRGSAIIRVAPKGSIVTIFCKVGGENVDGNSLWYLLTDGTWAWGAARYIDNIGAAPRFC
ncbi:SH3 domain-containing protein [Streptomyces sp. WI04-05B]|uniref:SH3 domain-containing protein n=1 Tax=Streptomyces TaxID=1883 RepID=UPI0029A4315C|nr:MULTISPECIES: SH3 domain-containing protein [unclassified Streptomyces]MDX2547358.1 SH3 domain-containing protein [Streptomyces sp. WI04-05B]MDX2589846.1 SH3 domain-containing protein [Streptomyces sp. WI04-05A]MDX3753416.1 SH3 domain-containing protein [Streptomyces sp. AK08-02]